MTDDSKDRWSALCRRPLPCGRRSSVIGFRSSSVIATGEGSSLPRRKIPWGADSVATAPSAPLVAQSGRARGLGLPRRNNSMGRSGAASYFRAERIVGQQDGHPHLRSAPAAGPRPAVPVREPVPGSRTNQVPPGPGPAPLALPDSACLGSACRARTTLPGAAGPLGGRRPGKPRRDPCRASLQGS